MMNVLAVDPELPAARRRLAGTERLMLALIGTLVDDLRGGDPRRTVEVRSYLAGEGAPEPFGFASICSHFGWSESLIRQELAKIGARPAGRRRWRSHVG